MDNTKYEEFCDYQLYEYLRKYSGRFMTEHLLEYLSIYYRYARIYSIISTR